MAAIAVIVSGVWQSRGMATETRHISQWIDRAAGDVYAYASDPANLPEWAPGLGSSIEKADGRGSWVVQTADGPVGLEFAPRNEFGVLDHWVTVPSGGVVYIPLRVIAGGAADCEVVFALRRMPGMNDEDYERDAAAVAADLARLKAVVEGR
jgi:hypothetical protein